MRTPRLIAENSDSLIVRKKLTVRGQVYGRRQLIDNRADPFVLSRYPNIVDGLRESVSRPFVLAV